MHLLSALDHADTFPLHHFRLPLLPTRNVILPTKRYLPLNALKTFPILPTPVYLALTLLHDARITSHLRDECKFPFAWHLAFAPHIQLHALTRLIIRAPPSPTTRGRCEA